ncbi:MAG: C45 family autoproteolytic acyltransferase/hydrolase [bacterium]
MKDFKMAIVVVILLAFTALQGCSSSTSHESGPSPSPSPVVVTLNRVNDLYYKVDINMQAAGHYDIGRQYALQIKNGVLGFESQVDAGLKAMFDQLHIWDEHLTFEKLVERAQAILPNIPTEYQDEIRGMQSVFSDTDDTLGNGKLSRNKLLVYELGPDVLRVSSCSASAAFGDATERGKTILGRNLEWVDVTLQNLAYLQTVAILHNGSKSIVLFGFLGQLHTISGLSAGGVFGAILDSDAVDSYLLHGNERSYPMDLRYALENQTSLQGIADFFGGKRYAYDFNIFLADADRAAVLEVDIQSPFSGLRTATSALKTEIPPWNFPNAIAVVNWFTLPGTIDNSGRWFGNAPRWGSFINLYQQYLAQGKITMDVMKVITGYPGPGPDEEQKGKALYGAIWRYNDGESEVQSIIMDMETLETWVSFQPAGQPPLHSPNYIQVFSGNPF